MTFIFDILQFYCKSEYKQVKLNKTKRDMCKSEYMFPNLQSISLFEICFLISFISNMNNNISRGEMSIISFRFVNVKGTWAHLAGSPGSPQYLGHHGNILIILSAKHFKNMFTLSSKSCYVIQSVILNSVEKKLNIPFSFLSLKNQV